MVRTPRPVRKRILLVEDEEGVSVEIEHYMRRFGYEVIACIGVRAARESLLAQLARASPPQVVLCDLALPDGDAGDIYLEFAPRLPGCRWVIMSGAIDLDELNGKIGRTPGPRPTVVDKPVSLHTLRALIEGEDSDTSG